MYFVQIILVQQQEQEIFLHYNLSDQYVIMVEGKCKLSMEMPMELIFYR